jgi:hypothetical protein
MFIADARQSPVRVSIATPVTLGLVQPASIDHLFVVVAPPAVLDYLAAGVAPSRRPVRTYWSVVQAGRRSPGRFETWLRARQTLHAVGR